MATALDWLSAACALAVYSAPAWAVYRLGRHAGNAVARRIAIRRYLRQIEAHANHPGMRRLAAEIRQTREEGQQS
ncbi:hypothetical protein [Streptomyces sp. NPDC058254]|uniref:hypothetical protein n=1 Tax=Streptomyces sp. NPDC058254 TaxID=3346406 RepID=UPI0036E71BA8